MEVSTMLNIIIDAIVTGVTTAAVAVGGFACDTGTFIADTAVNTTDVVCDFTVDTATAVADFTCDTAEIVYSYTPWGLMDQVNTLEQRLEEPEQENTSQNGNVIYWPD